MHLSMLSPTYPLPGVMGEMVGIWLFEKSNSPPMGEQLVVKSPCSMVVRYFRKQVNSFNLQVKTNA